MQYILLYQSSKKQGAIPVHKECTAGTYSHHMPALRALVKNFVKKTRAIGCP